MKTALNDDESNREIVARLDKIIELLSPQKIGAPWAKIGPVGGAGGTGGSISTNGTITTGYVRAYVDSRRPRVGDLVIHKSSGDRGRVAAVHSSSDLPTVVHVSWDDGSFSVEKIADVVW